MKPGLGWFNKLCELVDLTRAAIEWFWVMIVQNRHK